MGKAPIDVNAENAAQVYERMYGHQSRQRPVEPKLEVGQKVRISKTRRIFYKGYLPNWTEEIFTKDKAIGTDPPTNKSPITTANRWRDRSTTESFSASPKPMYKIEKNHSHETTSRGRWNGILRQVERFIPTSSIRGSTKPT